MHPNHKENILAAIDAAYAAPSLDEAAPAPVSLAAPTTPEGARYASFARKAPVDDTPPVVACAACAALNGERPCSVECYVAAGYKAEGYAERFGGAPPAA